MDDLGRLERENRELKRQVELLMSGWKEDRSRGKGRVERDAIKEVRGGEEDDKYEELVREMARLQTVISKV